MNIMPHVVCAMQTVLTVVADTAARTTGFIKRHRKLTGATFVQSLVFGWLSNPKATLEELSQAAATVGVDITPQSLDERFTKEAAETLKQVLDATVEQVVAADPQAVPLLERFNGVYVQDSSSLSLPDSLAEVFSGCGGKTDHGTQSAVKVQLRWEMLTGALCHLSLHDGRANDRQTLTSDGLPALSLRLADLGYFSLDDLKSLADKNAFWLTRIQAMCAIFDTEGNRKDLSQWLSKQPQTEVELSIRLGVEAQLECRLLAQHVSDEVASRRRRQLRATARRKGKTPSQTRLKLADWNLLATNVPAEKLTVKEAMILARVRWQIELLFKLWKSHGYIDEWRSQKPWRILCEVYAKLIAMIIQHWILLCGCWRYPNRSLAKAAKTVASHGLHLASAFASGQVQRLVDALTTIGRCLAAGCRIYKRKTDPSTYQLLLAITDEFHNMNLQTS